MRIPILSRLKELELEVDKLERKNTVLENEYKVLEKRTILLGEELKKSSDKEEEKNRTLDTTISELKDLLDKQNEKINTMQSDLRKYKERYHTSNILLKEPIEGPPTNIDALVKAIEPDADAGYNKVREVLIRQAIDKGYNAKIPFFELWDQGSGIKVKFYTTNREEGKSEKSYGNYKRIERFPVETHLIENKESKEKELWVGGSDFHTAEIIIEVYEGKYSDSMKEWTNKLREDLLKVYQFYIAGYGLACIHKGEETTDYTAQTHHGGKNVGVKLFKNHGIENKGLIAEMHKIVKKHGDEVLAGQIKTYFGKSEKIKG